MSKPTLHVFVAQGGDTRCSWSDSGSRVPRLRQELLAKRYLHEVDRSSAVIDVTDDDDGATWLLVGVTRPHYDGHRRDDRLLGLLIAWEEILAHWPLDFGALLNQWSAATSKLAQRFEWPELTSGDWARTAQWGLNGSAALPRDRGLELLAALALAEKVRVTVKNVDWTHLSQVLSLLPIAFARQLRCLVTDGAVPPKDSRLLIQCDRDPLASLGSAPRDATFEVVAPRGRSSYVEFVRGAQGTMGELWDRARHAVREVCADGPDALWPTDAGLDLLELVGQYALDGDQGNSTLDRMKKVREVASRQPEFRWSPRLKSLVEAPTAKTVVERALAGPSAAPQALKDLAALDPLLRVWMTWSTGDGVERLTGEQIELFLEALGPALVSRWAAHEQAPPLLSTKLAAAAASVLTDYVSQAEVLAPLSAAARGRILQWLAGRGERGAELEQRLTSFLSVGPPGELSSADEWAIWRELSRCARALTPRAAPEDRWRLLGVLDAWRGPAFVTFLAAADWHGRSLTTGLTEKLSSAEAVPPWTFWLVRRVAALASWFHANRTRGWRVSRAATRFMQGVHETFGATQGTAIGKWLHWARGERKLANSARSRLAKLLDQPRAFCEDDDFVDTQRRMVEATSEGVGIEPGSWMLARLYALGLPPDAWEANDALNRWFDDLDSAQWTEWLTLAAHAAEVFLEVDEEQHAPWSAQMALVILRLGSYASEE